MTTPRTMTLRELVAMVQGMVFMDSQVRLGFIASSAEAAKCTGHAVATMLSPYGVTWNPVHMQVRWPGGALMTFLSGQNPDRLRGYRWAAGLVSSQVAAWASSETMEMVRMSARSPGTCIILCTEVSTRTELEEHLRQVA